MMKFLNEIDLLDNMLLTKKQKDERDVLHSELDAEIDNLKSKLYGGRISSDEKLRLEAEILEKIKKERAFYRDFRLKIDPTTHRYVSFSSLAFSGTVDMEKVKIAFGGKILNGYRKMKYSDAQSLSFLWPDDDYDVAVLVTPPFDDIMWIYFRKADLESLGILKPEPEDRKPIDVAFIRDYKSHVDKIVKMAGTLGDNQAIEAVAEYIKNNGFSSIPNKEIEALFEEKPATKWPERAFPRRLFMMFAEFAGYVKPTGTQIDRLKDQLEEST